MAALPHSFSVIGTRPEWGGFQEDVQQQITEFTAQLVKSSDYGQMRELQGRIKALQELLENVEAARNKPRK
jgi:hypothetical protein